MFDDMFGNMLGFCNCCGCCPCDFLKKQHQEIKLLEPETHRKDSLKPLPKYIPVTFLPDIIVEKIITNSITSIPYSSTSEAVVLLCDVCNFTGLSEKFCEKGGGGVEELVSILNGYMSSLAGIMLHAEGDILSFAGDAFLVQWDLKGDEKKKNAILLKAYNCALNLQAHKSLQRSNLDGTLQVKLGMVIEEVTTWVLGTPEKNLVFVNSGRALTLVHDAEEMCSAGDIVVSREFFNALQKLGAPLFETEHLAEEQFGFVRIKNYKCTTEEELVPNRVVSFQACNDSHLATAKTYLLPSIRGVTTSAELNYLSELTEVTILFISLPDINVNNPEVLDYTFEIVLQCVTKQKGSINKMILFDKGCSFLVVFNLPGMKISDYAAYALICAHEIVTKHAEINLRITTGIASGYCYCGLVGHPQRQEYTVIGSTVNLAARLMTVYADEAIALDENTYHLSRNFVGDACFTGLSFKNMKGVNKKVKIYGCKIMKEKAKQRRLSSFLHSSESNEENEQEETQFERKMTDALKELADPKQRSKIQETLLPVILIETDNGTGKGFYTYATVNIAHKIGHKVVNSCTNISTMKNPFSTAAFMIMNVLGFEYYESKNQKQNKLLNVIPKRLDKHLYLLNHLFEVDFPYPRFVSIDKETRDTLTFEIFFAIFREIADNCPVVLAVDDTDSIDVSSWGLFAKLCKGRKYILVFNIHPEYKENCLEASILALKAHTHIVVRGPAASSPHFVSIACWHVGAGAMCKEIINYLREKTKGDVEILNEVLLHPTFKNSTELHFMDQSALISKNYLFSNFYSDDILKEVLVCNLKPGCDVRDIEISGSIKDAFRSTLNFLEVPDLLLLKRAAILGRMFDLHMLETISTGVSIEEVVRLVSKLIELKVLCATCTSPGVLENVNPSPIALKRFTICLCSKIIEMNPFYNVRMPRGCVSPYQRHKFRNSAFRDLIINSMPQEQFTTMHYEVVLSLEQNGLLCVSCKNKRLEAVQDGNFDLRATAIHVDFQQCGCLHLRPHLFNRISLMYNDLGYKLLPAYYKKKAAQATNDLGYPILGLILIEKGESYLSGKLKDVVETFDPVTLRASMYTTAAKSAILLNNYYAAASIVEKALNVLEMNCVWFYGFGKSKFLKYLKNLPTRQAEAVTKLTDVLAEAYVKAEKYELAKKYVLSYEFVALSIYPIDFSQMLNFNILMYISLTRTQPQKDFITLENNTQYFIRQRLLSPEVMLNLLEIQDIGKAFLVLIRNNIAKNRLHRARSYALECFKFLTSLQDDITMPFVLEQLIEMAMHQKDYQKGFELIQKLPQPGIDCPSVIYYYVALSNILKLKIDAKGKDKEDDTYVSMINEFTVTWTNRRLYYISKDQQFHATTCLAQWTLNAAKYYGWVNAKEEFNKCYTMASSLAKEQERVTYYNTGGALRFLEIKVDTNVVKSNPHGNLAELEKYKNTIKLHYPVYLDYYKYLKKKMTDLITEIKENSK